MNPSRTQRNNAEDVTIFKFYVRTTLLTGTWLHSDTTYGSRGRVSRSIRKNMIDKLPNFNFILMFDGLLVFRAFPLPGSSEAEKADAGRTVPSVPHPWTSPHPISRLPPAAHRRKEKLFRSTPANNIHNIHCLNYFLELYNVNNWCCII